MALAAWRASPGGGAGFLAGGAWALPSSAGSALSLGFSSSGLASCTGIMSITVLPPGTLESSSVAAAGFAVLAVASLSSRESSMAATSSGWLLLLAGALGGSGVGLSTGGTVASIET